MKQNNSLAKFQFTKISYFLIGQKQVAKFQSLIWPIKSVREVMFQYFLDTEHKLNVYKAYRRRLEHLLLLLMNYFCNMVDRRKAFSLISSRYHLQRSSLSRISDTPQEGFESAQNLCIYDPVLRVITVKFMLI